MFPFSLSFLLQLFTMVNIHTKWVISDKCMLKENVLFGMILGISKKDFPGMGAEISKSRKSGSGMGWCRILKKCSNCTVIFQGYVFKINSFQSGISLSKQATSLQSMVFLFRKDIGSGKER